MDVIVLDIRIHVADGICCGQQLHGPNGYKNNERLFGRKCPGHTNEWRQLKGNCLRISRWSMIILSMACIAIKWSERIFHPFFVSIRVYVFIGVVHIKTSESQLSIGHRWHRSTIHSAMDAPRHYTSINFHGSSFHCHSSSWTLCTGQHFYRWLISCTCCFVVAPYASAYSVYARLRCITILSSLSATRLIFSYRKYMKFIQFVLTRGRCAADKMQENQ